MRYHNITKDDMLNGVGLRVVLWVAGCSHCCKECHNPITWDPNGGLEFDAAAKQEIFEQLEQSYISGITFSGGEPFCQPEPLLKLAKEVHNLRKNVISYSGYTFEELLKLSEKNQGIKELMLNIDYLIDGKFILSEKTLMLKFRGSKNQRIIDVKKSMQDGQAHIAEL